jgi:hypothetical protein
MRRLAMLLLLATSAHSAEQAAQSPTERQAIRVVTEAKPTCTAGHEDAVSGGVVTIRPGETICVDLEISGRVVSISGVTSVESEKTLVLTFRRDTDPPSMILIVRNPLGSFLRYKASLLRSGAANYAYTSSCPVLSRRIGFEQWPYPIDALKLTAFEVLPDAKDMTCQ